MASLKVHEKLVRETEVSTSNAGGRNVRPHCDLDLDILECPICTEPLSPPVYQCPNGHPHCLACRVKISRCPACSGPIGVTRNLLAEEIVESLHVRCKYASHGCRQMLKYSATEEHLKNLGPYRPCPCPVTGCTHEGAKQSLVQHLEHHHQVKRIKLRVPTTNSGGKLEAKFMLKFSSENVRSRFVVVEDADEKVQMLVHREAIESLGHLFFCTTFGDRAVKYGLQVSSEPNGESQTMIANAAAEDVRWRENWKRDALLFSTSSSRKLAVGMLACITFSLPADVQAETGDGVHDLPTS